MKRRRFFKTIAALPAAQALTTQPAPAQPQAPARGSGTEIPVFQETSPELVAEAQPKFFTADQYAALCRLSALFMPPLDANPGALECQAPEFLDFLIGAEIPERQKLYRDGLDTLNVSAKSKFKKPFADLDDSQADAVVRPLLKPVAWAYDLPVDPAARFIAEARRDIRSATQNSREWATSGVASGRRRFGGGGNYVLPIDPTYRSN
jgi:Gluconate 2-dehydrogenase subunit 3